MSATAATWEELNKIDWIEVSLVQHIFRRSIIPDNPDNYSPIPDWVFKNDLFVPKRFQS